MKLNRQPSRQRRVRGLATTAALGLVAASLAAGPPSASAAVPAFPDNVVVFPNRDFVSVEGYAEYAGQTARLTVTRPGVGVMGSAESVISASGVAFEVNHPGGVCWGAGTTLDVTPDIIAGDVVSILLPDGREDSTTTSSATVSEHRTQSGTTVTVRGSVGPDVIPAQMEQRLVNPDLVALIGKRDVRAVTGPLTPAPRGGYASGLDVDPVAGTFVATYVFDDLATADVAAATEGERAMSWQVEDADANRQGLTIAEFGEPGGPGMGGCPAGPGQQEPPAGAASAIRADAGASMVVQWTAAAAQPGAEPITGYNIEVISDNATGPQDLRGRRVGVQSSQTTVGGLDPAQSYLVEVRSMAGLRLSQPFAMNAGPVDQVAPPLTAAPATTDPGTPVETDRVTLTTEPGGQIFYTMSASGPVPVLDVDLPSAAAQIYTGPVPITEQVHFSAVAFDRAGNHSAVIQGQYRPPPLPAPPPAPLNLAGTPTQRSVALTWAAGDAGVTGYQVTVADAADTPLATQPPVTTLPRQTVTELSPGTTYLFRVAAINAGGSGPGSAVLSVTTQPLTDSITIGTAIWKAGDFKVVGTGSQVGATVQLYRVAADGSVGAAIAGATASVVAGVPPAVGDWTVRLRNGAAPATNPGRIYARSSGGGLAGPFRVAAR